jgi:hypothetical protein
MEHSLFSIQLADRWKNTPSIAGKKDDVAWVICGNAGNLGVLNVLNGVCAVMISVPSSMCDAKRELTIECFR